MEENLFGKKSIRNNRVPYISKTLGPVLGDSFSELFINILDSLESPGHTAEDNEFIALAIAFAWAFSTESFRSIHPVDGEATVAEVKAAYRKASPLARGSAEQAYEALNNAKIVPEIRFLEIHNRIRMSL